MKRGKIIITDEDMKKLQALIDSLRLYGKGEQAQLDVLEEELNRAEVLRWDSIPHDIVTMNSKVCMTDLESGRTFTYQIVFPRDADISKNMISVLAPLGTALIGYRAGSEIVWNVPGGTRSLRIDAIEYQPEASRAAA